ncbi:conserved domain protein [Bacteroides fluxus YIT 12057]|uniref:Conserved domain protein n=1 Tax=Bacteroides fluxus YIT 12057 TaxID=763034 RepID=F3PY58_9BACE|nr:conserved domain protein [Bacteroides fluxus YIT 12057]
MCGKTPPLCPRLPRYRGRAIRWEGRLEVTFAVYSVMNKCNINMCNRLSFSSPLSFGEGRG